MANPELSISTALLKAVNEIAFNPKLPIAFPDVDFTPPPPARGAQWLRATMLPGMNAGAGINNNSAITHSGLLQVDVFTFPGDGEPNLLRLASLVFDKFKRGTSFIEGGQKVVVSKPPYRMNIVQDGQWAMLPVRVPYVCYAGGTEASPPKLSKPAPTGIGYMTPKVELETISDKQPVPSQDRQQNPQKSRRRAYRNGRKQS